MPGIRWKAEEAKQPGKLFQSIGSVGRMFGKDDLQLRPCARLRMSIESVGK
jgi:hypothetical protein